jgi:hypothetical protein
VTPQEFIAKWRTVELKERSASQSHFSDLCRLLGLDDPTTADQKGEWFAFEMGASKTGGGEGWAETTGFAIAYVVKETVLIREPIA